MNSKREMKTEQELAAFFERLKEQLLETTTFPTSYLYKFTLPNDAAKIAQLKEVFKDTDAEISTRTSSGGKYVGVSVKVSLTDADQVIHYYKEAGKVEGILSL